MQQLMCASPIKHPQIGKPIMQEKGKVIDPEPEAEVEELHVGADDIDMEEVADVDVEGSDPISKPAKDIPPRRGKAKVPKGIDESKVTLNKPLFPNQIVFDRACLGCIPLLKLED